MHDLKNFVPYDGTITGGEHIVLAWSRKDGYHFIQFGFILSDEVTIVAKEDK